MTPNLHLWLIPVLPLAGAAINGFFGQDVLAAERWPPLRCFSAARRLPWR